VSNQVMARQKGRAYLLVMLPVIMVAILAVGLLVFSGVEAAYSAGLGAIIWLLPNLYFIYKFFNVKNSRTAKELLWVFYRAEVLKLVLSALLFVIIIKLVAVLPFYVLGAFIIAQLVFLITIWFSMGIEGYR
jgi:ATP synthase protein I